MFDIQKLSDERALVGECPLWHPQEQMLYWVDIQGPCLFRTDPQSGETQRFYLPEKIGSIVWHKDGGLIGGMESGLFRLNITDGKLEVSRHLAADLGEKIRFNDGATDRQGRYIVGTMKDPNDGSQTGSLFRIDEQGLSKPLVQDLIIQNGVAWSPDGATMYLTDSHPTRQLVWAYDYCQNSGEISNQRILIDMKNYAGRPDGTAVDSEGYLWFAGNDEGLLYRFAPDGALDRTIKMPVPRITMCAFGGADLSRLFITTIGRHLATYELSDETDRGCLYAIDLDVKGLPEAAFIY